MRTSVSAAVAALAILTLTSCSAPSTDAATPSPTSTTTATVELSTPTPKPTPTSTAIDRTYEANQVGGGIISKAIEDPIGTISIYTDIALPYSDTQETARYEALIACEAVRAQMGPSIVRVLDASDSPFIFFNGDNYPECGFTQK